LALNLLAAVRLTNALLPALRESKAGAIVNVSSGAATMAVGAVAHYAAAKAALNSYSRALAIDLAPSKIRVNVVSPGPVTTPGSKAFTDALGAPPDLFAKEIPLGRYGSPEDLAEVVALLVSNRGNWMTGGIINVDGGMSAR
jgi:NAD(P)-dependent dehydrogenase (short-subunit alcohol dehydrogenase family)